MEKVVVGMSGGIDSSMTAYLLKEKGYEVIGITLKHLGEDYDDDSNSKTCCSLDDIYDAKSACFHIGIPHYVIDASEDFEKEVIDYFVNEYDKGRTPSPCVVCDEKIKIQKLVNIADKFGAKYIATGHYAGRSMCKELGVELLSNAEDIKKDQTYMLYRLKEDIVKRMLFPLEKYKKEEIREMAKKIGFSTHDKKDSQGICFAPNGYIDFLQDKLADKIKKGDFVDRQGNIMGKHNGYQLYTIGQRRGLGLQLPRAYFVVEINPEKNQIVLGEFDELSRVEVELVDTKFIVPIEKLLNKELVAKARFSSKGSFGKVIKKEEKIYFVYSDENKECAPGQHMVIYYKDRVVGGGVINS